MTTKTEKKKAINQQLRDLRATWRRWRYARPDDPGFIELDLVCPIHRNAYRGGRPLLCSDPTCIGCASTLYRADQMSDVKAQADALKAQLLQLDRKTVDDVQEPLFP